MKPWVLAFGLGCLSVTPQEARGASGRALARGNFAQGDSDGHAVAMNVQGDWLMASGVKLLVSWRERFAALKHPKPLTGGMWSGGVADRNEWAFGLPAALACSQGQIWIFDPLEADRHPTGKWLSLPFATFSASDLVCAMQKDGSWAAFDRARQVVFLNGTDATTLEPKWRNAHLIRLAGYFALVGGDGRVLVLQKGGTRPREALGRIVPPVPMAERTTLRGEGDLVVGADDYGAWQTRIAVGDEDTPRVGETQRIPVAACDEEQRCAVSVAFDQSIGISGFWGTWMGRLGDFSTLPMTLSQGRGGVASFAHSGRHGHFIVVGPDDADYGPLDLLAKTRHIGRVKSKNIMFTADADDRPMTLRQRPSLPHIPEIALDLADARDTPSWAKDVGRDEAWALAKVRGVKPEPVMIGVVDSGMDLEHPLLIRAVARRVDDTPRNERDDDGNGYVDDHMGYDFVEEQGSPRDMFGHGTHVAGLLASGVDTPFATAFNAKVIVARALDRWGKSSSIDLARAIDYAVASGAEVLNCSWGGGARTLAVERALRSAYDAGVMLFASAGNDHLDTDRYPEPPSALPGVVAVGAVDAQGELARFSNYGRQRVMLMAPGVHVLSAIRGGGVGTMSGTSMASPVAASGAAWLLGLTKAVAPTLTRVERRNMVLEAMCATARKDKTGDLSRCGTIDLRQATERILRVASGEQPG